MNYWWKNTVIYEVYVEKFAKDFRGMADKLDYLKNLGIDCIWLLPHYPSPMFDDGYDVSDYFNVRNELGTLEDFKDFINKAHDKGIRVIVDLVLNHVSVDHPWFKEASSSENNPKRNYFIWSKTGKELEGSANPFSHMKSSNWAYNEPTNDYYYATFFTEQADLNWDNPGVFDEMIKIMDFWIGLGVNGFRLDAAGHLIKREGTASHHLAEGHAILKKIRKHLNANSPEVILLAEASGPVSKVKPYFGSGLPAMPAHAGQAGDECHMVFNFALMSNTYLAIKRNDMSVIDNIIKESLDIPDNCQWATFIGNHDEINLKSLTEEEGKEVVSWLDPDNLYSFGGGAGVSMRLATIFKGDKDKILNTLEILFNLPGSPVIYYGSEIGMQNLSVSNNFVDSRKYVRGDFDWEEAERQLNDPKSILNGLKNLISKRK